MSAQYNVDFSKARPGMRLADFADEVRAQKGNYGSFDELLKTTDPAQSVEEFGRRFLVDRILVATGTPKSIVDKLEEIHVASGANGGFILGRGYRRWTTSASSSSSSFRSCNAAGYPRRPIPVRRCGTISTIFGASEPASVPRLCAYGPRDSSSSSGLQVRCSVWTKVVVSCGDIGRA